MAYNVTVTFNGQQEEATLDAVGASERQMGADIEWEVELDSNSEVVLRFSEYPTGGFTEVERDPSLTTPLNHFTSLITTDREPKDAPEV